MTMEIEPRLWIGFVEVGTVWECYPVFQSGEPTPGQFTDKVRKEYPNATIGKVEVFGPFDFEPMTFDWRAK